MSDVFTDNNNEAGELSYTLKILFGPMYSSDLILPPNTYSIIIGRSQALMIDAQGDEQGHACQYAHNTLFIPYASRNVNMTLHLPATQETGVEGQGDYVLKISYPEAPQQRWLTHNAVFSDGDIHFAVKRAEEEWHQDISEFKQPSVNQATVGDASVTWDKLRKRRVLVASVLAVFMLLIAAGIGVRYYRASHQIISLTAALAGSPSPVTLLQGNDGKIYALARQYRDLQWLNAALAKRPNSADVVPLWLTQTAQDITNKLSLEGVPVLRLDMARPDSPVLLVLEGMTQAKQNALRKKLLPMLPYAKTLGFRSFSKNFLVQQAKQALDRMHIVYRQVSTPFGFTFLIHDELNDNTMAELQGFMETYYSQWGSDFITFSINLDENWLRDKSYLAAPNGYVFVNQHNWYFPSVNSLK